MAWKEKKLDLHAHLRAIGLHDHEAAEKAGVPVLTIQHAGQRGKISQAHADKILAMLSKEFGRPIKQADIDGLETC